MKRIFALMLCAALLLALPACREPEPPAVPEPPPSSEPSEPEPYPPEPPSSSEPEQEPPQPEPLPLPEPQPLPEPEPEQPPQSQPPAVPVDDPPMESPPFEGTGIPLPDPEPPEWKPERLITFRISDENGNPLPYVSGGIEMTFGEGASGAVAYSGLMSGPSPGVNAPNPDELYYSDSDGCLYYQVAPGVNDNFLGNSGKLLLRAHYDSKSQQTVKILMPESAPAIFDITWKGAPPPSEKPPQTTGVRFLIIDRDGRPVEGVTLFGTDYPKEHKGPVPAIAGPFIGPTDKTGVIRWESDFEPGTYALSFYIEGVEGSEQPYTMKHPGGEELLEITIVWKGAPPPSENLQQTSGFIFRFVDKSGNPVKGISMGGSPYPLETEGEINDIGIELGPSDSDGIIRWENMTRKGTYELYAHRLNDSVKHTFKHPGGEKIVERTIVWEH